MAMDTVPPTDNNASLMTTTGNEGLENEVEVDDSGTGLILLEAV